MLKHTQTIVRLLSTNFLSVFDHFVRFCPYTGEYGLVKTCILACFIQCQVLLIWTLHLRAFHLLSSQIWVFRLIFVHSTPVLTFERCWKNSSGSGYHCQNKLKFRNFRSLSQHVLWITLNFFCMGLRRIGYERAKGSSSNLASNIKQI